MLIVSESVLSGLQIHQDTHGDYFFYKDQELWSLAEDILGGPEQPGVEEVR